MFKRRGLDAQFDLLTALAKRSVRLLRAVTFNIDRFKRVDDQHRYAVGDAVLQWLAAQLQQPLHVLAQTVVSAVARKPNRPPAAPSSARRRIDRARAA